MYQTNNMQTIQNTTHTQYKNVVSELKEFFKTDTFYSIAKACYICGEFHNSDEEWIQCMMDESLRIENIYEKMADDRRQNNYDDDDYD